MCVSAWVRTPIGTASLKTQLEVAVSEGGVRDIGKVSTISAEGLWRDHIPLNANSLACGGP
jgi:hypothetical protein